MGRTRFDQMTCSIARTLDVIGDAWTPLVIRDLAVGITRFDAIQSDLGISRKVLSRRLAELEEHGVVNPVPYQENPTRHDYRLTEKGAELVAVLLAMTAWGDRWVFAESGPPVLIRHESCGQTTRALVACASCGEELRPGEVTPLAGPGLVPGPGTAGVAATLERLHASADGSLPSESPVG